MKTVLSVRAMGALLLFATAAAQAQKQWTVEDIYRNGGPTGTAPRSFEWSPDGRLLTFLAADDKVGKTGDLLALETATGKLTVLATKDKLTAAPISEKDKDHRARYGMPSYTWAADSKHLILDAGGVVALYDVAAGTATRIVDTGNGSGDDPKFSPDAKSISYLRDHNLFVAPATPNSHHELNLSRTTGDATLNGEVDWVYLEELDVRSNYFWAPDSQHLIYLQADESKVPQYPLTDLNETHATVDMQRYPQPGDPNPAVRVGIVSAKGGSTTWIDVPFSAGNDYIPRFGWVDAKTVYVEVLTRDQKHLNLYLADAKSGKSHLIFTDTDTKYLDTNYDVTFIDASRFLFTSWRDGHTHLYLYAVDATHPLTTSATLTRQLTQGDFEVESLLGVDPKTQTAFYLSSEGDPIQNAVWSIQLDGTHKQRLSSTQNTGTYRAVFAPDFKHYLNMNGSILKASTISLCDLNQACTPIYTPHTLADLGYTAIQPQILHLKAKDGTTLYGSLLLPPNATSAASVPLILNPYGGTHAQNVRNAWGGGNQLFDQLLAQHGFAVLDVDNRGMGGRGRDFEQFAYNNFGPVQLEDQISALDQVLVQFPQLDTKRIGFWGWSWGGSFTLYAMEHSDRFKAGIAVAPVTDWRNYDSVYTERYLGLPAANAAIYDADADVKAAAQLKGKLLLVHGTGDDNVHLANSIQQQEALINAHVPFDLQLYPRKTHSIAGYDARTHLFNRILQQFETNLK
ncbi:MAG TPA: DPP IV N-terminal domain-containing protein [Acidobacteriaceae bacterium]